MSIERMVRNTSKYLHVLFWPLSILSVLFWLISRIRAWYLGCIRKKRHATIPIWTVGNISVGGSGKTPLISWLIQHMPQYTCAIVSSGYARNNTADYWRAPYAPIDHANLGDEMAMLALQFPHIGCSVATNKWRAIQAVPQGFDYIIVDDGLQRYDIPFSCQIATVDLSYEDKYLLPRGLLREPRSRLRTVDCIVLTNPPACNYAALQTEWMERYDRPVAIADSVITHFFTENRQPYSLPGQASVTLVSAIAKPERFAASIRKLGFTVQHHYTLPDHADISDQQLHQFAQSSQCVIIATQKDFARKQQWPKLRVPCIFAAHSFQFVAGEDYIRGLYEKR